MVQQWHNDKGGRHDRVNPVLVGHFQKFPIFSDVQVADLGSYIGPSWDIHHTGSGKVEVEQHVGFKKMSLTDFVQRQIFQKGVVAFGVIRRTRKKGATKRGSWAAR